MLGPGPVGPPQDEVRIFLWACDLLSKAVGGGYCRLQMPLKPALGVRETVAGHRLGALESGGGGGYPSNASLFTPKGMPKRTDVRRPGQEHLRPGLGAQGLCVALCPVTWKGVYHGLGGGGVHWLRGGGPIRGWGGASNGIGGPDSRGQGGWAETHS